VIALVGLRLVVGWHFYKEGAKKFKDSAAFDRESRSLLLSAKGPFSPLVKAMVPDPYGENRLDFDATKEEWVKFCDRVIESEGLDDEADKEKTAKANEAKQVCQQYVDQLETYLLAQEAEAIEKYKIRLDAWLTAQKEPDAKLDNRQAWIAKESMELRGMAGPWLAEVDRIRDAYHHDLMVKVVGYKAEDLDRVASIPDPANMTLLNTMIKWTVILVGIGLLLGLFTELWSVVGIGFLMTVVISQFPGSLGAVPTYYQVVEIFALAVLGITSAGRWAGLDFFIHSAIKLRRNGGFADDAADK